MRCRSDFLGVLQAVESAAPGEVVVVDGGGMQVALAGEKANGKAKEAVGDASDNEPSQTAGTAEQEPT